MLLPIVLLRCNPLVGCLRHEEKTKGLSFLGRSHHGPDEILESNKIRQPPVEYSYAYTDTHAIHT